jgi:23S rRNA (cytidine1920-2'-O)/16S rRNA (cytidine1409-2'-O)-methyltransferase
VGDNAVVPRLDVVLAERGLADSRSRAQALIMAGRVSVDGRIVTKAGTSVAEGAELAVAQPPRFVSRGGDKLAVALEAFGVDPAGRLCLDVGASTGGFSDALLQGGAAAVIALDVGRGQLHERLRADPRVTPIDSFNVRTLTPADLPFAPDLAVIDVSFISLGLVLGPVLRSLARPSEAIALVKPQFEAGRSESKRGVVRDPSVHLEVLSRVAGLVPPLGAVTLGAVSSGHPGPAGNREFLLHVVSSDHPLAKTAPADLDAVLSRAVA